MTPRTITRLSITLGLIILAIALVLSRAIPDATEPVPLPPILVVTPLPPEVLPGPPAPTQEDRFRADMEALKEPIAQPVVQPEPAPQPQPTYAPQPKQNYRRGLFRR